MFHGGEPLLFPKRRFDAFLKKLRAVEERTGCMIKRGVTTNAILVDDEWIGLFKEHDISVTVSLDGPAEINDKFRVDFKGRGTLAQTLEGLALLRAAGLDPGLISVCNPGTDPEKVLDFVVNELGYKQFDILPPDATHADNPPPIDDYFIRLFDVWFDKYAALGVNIDTLDAMIRGLVGQLSLSDTIGLGPIDTDHADAGRLARAARRAAYRRRRLDGDQDPRQQQRHQGRARRSGLGGGLRGLDASLRDLPEMRIPGCLRRRSSGAALVDASGGSTIRASIARAGSASSVICGTGSRRP